MARSRYRQLRFEALEDRLALSAAAIHAGPDFPPHQGHGKGTLELAEFSSVGATQEQHANLDHAGKGANSNDSPPAHFNSQASNNPGHGGTPPGQTNKPNHAGNGSTPDKTPPSHSNSQATNNPGQGGVSPGQAKKPDHSGNESKPKQLPPSNSNSQTSSNPGHGGTPPGQANKPNHVGNDSTPDKTPPSHSNSQASNNPGHNGTPPGQANKPNHADNGSTPDKTHPSHSNSQASDNSGNGETPPGQTTAPSQTESDSDANGSGESSKPAALPNDETPDHSTPTNGAPVDSSEGELNESPGGNSAAPSGASDEQDGGPAQQSSSEPGNSNGGNGAQSPAESQSGLSNVATGNPSAVLGAVSHSDINADADTQEVPSTKHTAAAGDSAPAANAVGVVDATVDPVTGGGIAEGEDSTDVVEVDLADITETAVTVNAEDAQPVSATVQQLETLKETLLASVLESGLAGVLVQRGELLTDILPFDLPELEQAIDNLLNEISKLTLDLNDPYTRLLLSWALTATAAAMLAGEVLRRQAKLKREAYYWDPHLGWMNAPK